METEPELVAEEETDTVDESMDDSPTFWTACPYCFYMYEYPKRYVECTLRCDNCRRAFQAVPVPSPPPTIEGQDAYFYCWGFFPVGVSMSDLQKNNSSKGTKSKWTPFSPLYDASQNHLNECAAPKENTFVNKSSGPRVSFNDMLNEVSELSDDSDIEWDKTQKKKLKRMSNDMISDFKGRVQVLALRARDTINGNDKNKKNSTQGRVGVPTVPVAETSKKFVGSISRKLSGGVAKESGKLDLNVEFDNHVAAGIRGHEDGEEEEDNIEGIGFFEGLDEFLNNLPILSANEEKVKAT
ncbi:hypothetical protein Tco_1112484 [Tanacetum coccineum]|uniref:Zinc beta-ribbon domain-containing protein n=1 Tax=Tanacetum coccineum TaxID=301880 RepID=A0ABQ5IPZ8_9ASTR